MIRKIRYNSPVILTFAIVSLGALILSYFTNGRSNSLVFSVYRSSFLDPLTYVRFFTHVLGHGSFEHYLNNMLLLLVVGPPLEEKYGSRNILGAITVTALIAGVAHFTFFPGTALLGASGIVFMLILLSSFAGIKGGQIPLTLILVAILYLGGEIVDGLFVKDNVSQLSHIIGGICGAFAGFEFTSGKRKRR